MGIKDKHQGRITLVIGYKIAMSIDHVPTQTKLPHRIKKRVLLILPDLSGGGAEHPERGGSWSLSAGARAPAVAQGRHRLAGWQGALRARRRQ